MLTARPMAADMPRRTCLTVRPWEPIDVSTKPWRKCPASLPEMTQPLSRRMLPRVGEAGDGMGVAVLDRMVRCPASSPCR